IGAEAGGYRGLQGAMDDVRIYNTALSLEEIQNIMSPQAPLRMQLSMDNSSSEVEDVTMASDPFLFKKEIPEIIHAYPNPFANVTTVKFSFARDTDYTTVMYDINGREVLNLGNGTTSGGEVVQVEIDASSLAQGVYFLRIQSHLGQNKSIRLILRR